MDCRIRRYQDILRGVDLSIPEVTQCGQVDFLEKKVKIMHAEPTSVCSA